MHFLWEELLHGVSQLPCPGSHHPAHHTHCSKLSNSHFASMSFHANFPFRRSPKVTHHFKLSHFLFTSMICCASFPFRRSVKIAHCFKLSRYCAKLPFQEICKDCSLLQVPLFLCKFPDQEIYKDYSSILALQDCSSVLALNHFLTVHGCTWQLTIVQPCCSSYCMDVQDLNPCHDCLTCEKLLPLCHSQFLQINSGSLSPMNL